MMVYCGRMLSKCILGFLMLICGFKYWCEKCASMEFLGVKLCSFNVYIMRVSIRELQHYKRMNSSKSQCAVIGVLGGSEIRVLDFRTFRAQRLSRGYHSVRFQNNNGVLKEK